MLMALRIVKKREQVVVSAAWLLEAPSRAYGQENDALEV